MKGRYKTKVLAAKALAKRLGDCGDGGGWIRNALGNLVCQGWDAYASRKAEFKNIAQDGETWVITPHGEEKIVERRDALQWRLAQQLIAQLRLVAVQADAAAKALEADKLGRVAWVPAQDVVRMSQTIDRLSNKIQWEET
jgi:hypothetical protein